MKQITMAIILFLDQSAQINSLKFSSLKFRLKVLYLNVSLWIRPMIRLSRKSNFWVRDSRVDSSYDCIFSLKFLPVNFNHYSKILYFKVLNTCFKHQGVEFELFRILKFLELRALNFSDQILHLNFDRLFWRTWRHLWRQFCANYTFSNFREN